MTGWCLVAMVAVVVGHIWPVQLLFRGGKGMATSLGALIIYDYRLALVFALLFAATAAALRKSVLPGLFSLACVPLMSWYLAHSPADALGTSVLAGVVLLAHRQNLVTELSQFLDRRNIHPRHHPPEL